MTLRNPLATHGISVIEPTSPEFTTEAQKFLAPSVFAKVAAYLSAGAILINNTVQYIWGFTVIYSYPNWYSASGRPHSIWLNPSAGIPSLPKSRMLPPGRELSHHTYPGHPRNSGW
jgi:hypothetical protein